MYAYIVHVHFKWRVQVLQPAIKKTENLRRQVHPGNGIKAAPAGINKRIIEPGALNRCKIHLVAAMYQNAHNKILLFLVHGQQRAMQQ